MCMKTTSLKRIFAAFTLAMAFGTPLVPAFAEAGLLVPKAAGGAGNSAQPGGYASGQGPTKAPPSDKGLDNYIKACHDWGGGPSTDPEGNSRCTRPDGTTVVDS